MLKLVNATLFSRCAFLPEYRTAAATAVLCTFGLGWSAGATCAHAKQVMIESPAEQAESRPAGSETAGTSRLEFGAPSKAGKQEALVPLVFSPAEGETVGEIRAEVVVPEGPWRFRRLEAPKGSPWKARSKQRTEETRGSGGEKRAVRVLELQLTAGSRAIPGGQIGTLRFALERPDSPLPDSLTLRRVETSPPTPEMLREESFPPPSEDPSTNPATSCFFFTH